MNPEDLQKTISDKEIAIKELTDKLAKAESDKTNTVSELKEMREKKQQAEADRDLLKAKLDKLNGGESVDDAVKKILEADKAKTIAKNQENALSAFKNSHKELFDESNDPGGLKFKAFEQKLSRINTNGLETEQDFISAYSDALILLNRGQQSPDKNNNNENGYTPRNGGGQPRQVDVSQLSQTEKELTAELGWTEERFLKIKKSKPAYVAQLLKSRNISE